MTFRNLPNLKICRTKPFGSNAKIYLCLVPLSYSCKYSFHYNKQYFCNHPEKEMLCKERKSES